MCYFKKNIPPLPSLPHCNPENQDDCSDRGEHERGVLGRPLGRSSWSSWCLGCLTSCISDLERDYGIRVIGIRGIVCLLHADRGDECLCRIAALQASRAGDPEKVRTVVHVQAADVIPADIDIEPVVLHRVLDNHEVLAACKVTGDLLGDYILVRGIRVDRFN